MAQQISRLHSLKTQLFTVFGALTAAMLYYALSAIFLHWQELKSLDGVADAQKVAVTSGSLAHELQKERGLSYLLITHDVEVVRAMAHDVMVMKDGSVVEHGPVDRVLGTPQHPYTRRLVEAALPSPP